jgi:uncharacterized protein (DUF1810 family)
MSDPHDLQRFVDAQEPVYSRVLAELKAAHKTSHWMWFVFPQAAGLGSSPMARKFAVASLEEAGAYLAHDVLGPRLRECTQLMLAAAGRPVGEILGYPDDLKFRSSMTLFAIAEDRRDSIFEVALREFFDGVRDLRTEEALNRRAARSRISTPNAES